MEKMTNGGQDVPTQVKNRELVTKRRRQIVDASVSLFIKNGFHKTTTRQIARAAGFSIGNLYEYVATKEDILYLVCDAIHAEMEANVDAVLSGSAMGLDALRDAVRGYFTACDKMSDPIVLIYQVTQFLPKKWMRRVLENEIRVTDIFRKLLKEIVDREAISGVDDRRIDLAAHNIAVLGHAWAFRRWFYEKNYSLDEYIDFQTQNILGAFTGAERQG
ncbi:MAG: TetR/AcrR family transcriptional regulator [Thermodesulfobacteriota bacterium]|nr:TetR/AcrR family transcriptional regulator [Thermodesulfobacteriota bacterium]